MLEVEEISAKADFARAAILKIISPGPDRADAACRHYDSCGGCALQHLSQAAYKKFKTDIVTTALGYAGFDAAPQFHFMKPDSRRRADFKVANGKLAYVSARSHERVAIDTCPILTPKLNALIAPLNTLLAQFPATAVQITEADSGIDIQIESRAKLSEATLRNFAQAHGVARINHVTLKPVAMRFGGVDVPLPPQAFLQACKEAEALMASRVTDAAKGAKNIVEFFSGLGTYTFALARHAQVTAYELDAAMVAAMAGMKQKNIKAARRDLFKQPLGAKELKGFDCAVINPPRSGAAAQTEQLAKSGIAKIIMVSCNHATWSRDAKTLKNAGYALAALDVIDQFVYSPHVELVSVFEKTA